MNKNGKSNILILILMPVFVIMTLVIADTVISYTLNKQFKNDTENIITTVMNNSKLSYEDYHEEIKKLYENKGYDTGRLIVNADKYKVTVDNEHRYFGLISSITNSKAEKEKIKIYGIEFNVKKGSKTVISVEAKYNHENELEFEYVS